jgi:branched-chain amino acid transport system substrate-binding protein
MRTKASAVLPNVVRAAAVSWLVVWLLASGCRADLPPLPPTGDASQPTLRVAVLVPMTGELATFGEIVRRAAGQAFDEWNDRGGVNGRRIQMELEDTPCEAEEARRAARRVIGDGVRLMVGTVCSEAAIPVARVADEQGALFVAANATHPLVTVDDTGAVRRLAFRVAFPYPYQARAAAKFVLDSLKIRRAAVLNNPANAFERSLADEFGVAFAAGGGQVVARASTSPDADLSFLVADAVSSGAQALYVPGGPDIANRVGAAVQARSLDPIIVGSDLWTKHALDLAVLEGAYFVDQYSHEAPGNDALDWAERYQAAFASEPDTLAALGYDAANLLATALQQAHGDSPLDVAGILERMQYKGASGQWEFDDLHNPLKDAVILQVRDGDIRWAAQASVR